jgi:hypothetical protein
MAGCYVYYNIKKKYCTITNNYLHVFLILWCVSLLYPMIRDFFQFPDDCHEGSHIISIPTLCSWIRWIHCLFPFYILFNNTYYTNTDKYVNIIITIFLFIISVGSSAFDVISLFIQHDTIINVGNVIYNCDYVKHIISLQYDLDQYTKKCINQHNLNVNYDAIYATYTSIIIQLLHSDISRCHIILLIAYVISSIHFRIQYALDIFLIVTMIIASFNKDTKKKNTKYVLIGLLGKKQSGKDTAGDYLQHKYGFTKYSFADPLKQACHILFDLNHDQLYGSITNKETIDPRWNKTPRQILQYVGTDLMRNQIRKDFWTHLLKLKYKSNQNTVVTDCRFQNEVDCIHELGGVVIKIIRPDSKHSDSHASEIDMDCITNHNYTIHNNDELNVYYEKIDMVYESVLNKTIITDE